MESMIDEKASALDDFDLFVAVASFDPQCFVQVEYQQGFDWSKSLTFVGSINSIAVNWVPIGSGLAFIDSSNNSVVTDK